MAAKDTVIQRSDFHVYCSLEASEYFIENFRKYRGQKLSKGQRRIPTRRYFYQPKDIVIYEGKKHTVEGIQNKGTYIKLAELSKPVKINLVKPYMFRKGLCVL